MKFIVGIGNPGEKYKKTRHNVGFEVLFGIRNRNNLTTEKRLTKSLLIPFGDSYLVRPNTYVNNTGQAIQNVIQELSVLLNKQEPIDFLIVSDDVNLAFGKLRFRESGSRGGHHGLESVIASLGTEDFPRLRIGVANERMPKDLTSFVQKK